MDYKQAFSNLIWRFIFVVGWNAVPYYAYISSSRRSDLGNLPFGLMAFAGMILAAVLLGNRLAILSLRRQTRSVSPEPGNDTRAHRVGQ